MTYHFANLKPGGLKITCGYYHSLALTEDGTVIGWGDNNFGKRTIPPGLKNVKAISAGSDFSLALLS